MLGNSSHHRINFHKREEQRLSHLATAFSWEDERSPGISNNRISSYIKLHKYLPFPFEDPEMVRFSLLGTLKIDSSLLPHKLCVFYWFSDERSGTTSTGTEPTSLCGARICLIISTPSYLLPNSKCSIQVEFTSKRDGVSRRTAKGFLQLAKWWSSERIWWWLEWAEHEDFFRLCRRVDWRLDYRVLSPLTDFLQGFTAAGFD